MDFFILICYPFKMYSKELQTYIKENLILNTGNVNSAVIRQQWFKDSDEYQEILKQTKWVNLLNPDMTLSGRIHIIHQNITEFERCKSCNSYMKFNSKSNYCSPVCIAIGNKIINRRLLEYPLESFDYTKINNQHYLKRQYNVLLLWYYYNKTKNLKRTILFTKTRCGPNWYRTLEKLNLIDIIKSEFGTADKDQILLIAHDKKCKACGKPILNTRKFCSIKCSNNWNSTSEKFKSALSKGLSKHHSKLTEEEKSSRYFKISNTLKKTNSILTDEERSLKYSNINPQYTAFSNLTDRFPDLELLFDEDFYYRNRYLPVRCRKCGFEWELTKSTTISRTECKKCFPSKKHQTQTEIFHYVNSVVPAFENSRNLIQGEIDILVPKLNFGIEYNGLLPHSVGPSRIHYYNKFEVDKSYHLRKTEACEEQGYQLFHIFENEFLNPVKRKIWYSMIDNKLNKSKRIFARKCTLRNFLLKMQGHS